MHTEFYGLHEHPFQMTPNARLYFPSTAHRRAHAHLTYGLAQHEGFIVVTGEVGAGKTTLIERLCEELDPHGFVIARISTTLITGDDVLRMVADAFGAEPEGNKAAVLRGIAAALRHSPRRHLLIVDEAQGLVPSALEELRMLSNLTHPGQPPLQTLLMGQPQLRRLLVSPALAQLRQRVLASYHLGGLTREETHAYVLHRLRAVGWDGRPSWEEAALDLVHAHSDGLPRRINRLCARVLLSGALEERDHLTAEMVAMVAQELEQDLGGGAMLRSPAPRAATPRREAAVPLPAEPQAAEAPPAGTAPMMEPPPALAEAIPSADPEPSAEHGMAETTPCTTLAAPALPEHPPAVEMGVIMTAPVPEETLPEPRAEEPAAMEAPVVVAALVQEETLPEPRAEEPAAMEEPVQEESLPEPRAEELPAMEAPVVVAAPVQEETLPEPRAEELRATEEPVAVAAPVQDTSPAEPHPEAPPMPEERVLAAAAEPSAAQEEVLAAPEAPAEPAVAVEERPAQERAAPLRVEAPLLPAELRLPPALVPMSFVAAGAAPRTLLPGARIPPPPAPMPAPAPPAPVPMLTSEAAVMFDTLTRPPPAPPIVPCRQREEEPERLFNWVFKLFPNGRSRR